MAMYNHRQLGDVESGRHALHAVRVYNRKQYEHCRYRLLPLCLDLMLGLEGLIVPPKAHSIGNSQVSAKYA